MLLFEVHSRRSIDRRHDSLGSLGTNYSGVFVFCEYENGFGRFCFLIFSAIDNAREERHKFARLCICRSLDQLTDACSDVFICYHCRR